MNTFMTIIGKKGILSSIPHREYLSAERIRFGTMQEITVKKAICFPGQSCMLDAGKGKNWVMNEEQKLDAFVNHPGGWCVLVQTFPA